VQLSCLRYICLTLIVALNTLTFGNVAAPGGSLKQGLLSFQTEVVLSSFSSVFQSILKNNPHSYPLLYLTGLEEQDVTNLLDFIYLGETKVAQSDIQRFMDVAEKFKISGLSNNTKKNEKSDKPRREGKVQNAFNDVPPSFVPEVVKSEEFVDEYTRDEGKLMIAELDEGTTTAEEQDLEPSLDESKRKFSCNNCDYKATQSGSLKVHVMAIHQGIRFPCQVCDYKGTTKGNTKNHMRNKHTL
jgi:hypothetical protein